jgi:hypothetical protein
MIEANKNTATQAVAGMAKGKYLEEKYSRPKCMSHDLGTVVHKK